MSLTLLTAALVVILPFVSAWMSTFEVPADDDEALVLIMRFHPDPHMRFEAFGALLKRCRTGDGDPTPRWNALRANVDHPEFGRACQHMLAELSRARPRLRLVDQPTQWSRGAAVRGVADRIACR